LPPVLSAGGHTSGEESPWWLFHRLCHAATSESESGVRYVREQWAEFQNSLLESAYQVAREARGLLDNGLGEKASGLLTDYMRDNSAEMLTRLGRNAEDFCSRAGLKQRARHGHGRCHSAGRDHAPGRAGPAE
jgi:hypothetical protein